MPMQQFQCEQLVNLRGVVPVTLDVTAHDLLDGGTFEVRARQTSRIEQGVADVGRELPAVPDSVMKRLVPAQEQAFKTQRREEMIEAREPLRHPVVVRVFSLECELLQRMQDAFGQYRSEEHTSELQSR